MRYNPLVCAAAPHRNEACSICQLIKLNLKISLHFSLCFGLFCGAESTAELSCNHRPSQVTVSHCQANTLTHVVAPERNKEVILISPSGADTHSHALRGPWFNSRSNPVFFDFLPYLILAQISLFCILLQLRLNCNLLCVVCGLVLLFVGLVAGESTQIPQLTVTEGPSGGSVVKGLILPVKLRQVRICQLPTAGDGSLTSTL
eukprot:sb/3470571/